MRRLAVVLTLAVLGPAAPALAEDYHVAPGAAGDCVNFPCTLSSALQKPGSGHRILLAAGDYTSESPVLLDRAFTLEREEGETGTPVLGPVTAQQPVTLRDVTITGTGTVLTLEASATGSLVERVTATQSGGTGPAIASAAPGLTITDCTATGETGASLTADADVHRCTFNGTATGLVLGATHLVANTVARGIHVTGGTATLVHVTSVAAAAPGLLVDAAATAVAVRNSILRGTPDDVSGTATIESSLASGVDPQFVDAAAGDFRVRETSPAVDAGAQDAQAGTLDRAGATRVRCKPDQGAYELQRDCPVVDPPSNGGGDPPSNGSPPPPPPSPPASPSQPAAAPPVGLLSRLGVPASFSHVRLRVDSRRRLSVALRLSDDAQVTFLVEKRRGKRWRRVTSVTRSLSAGLVKTRLTTRAVSAGVYRVSATVAGSGTKRDSERVRAPRKKRKT